MEQVESQREAAPAVHKLLPVGLIRESKTNPRTHFDQASLEELAKSIGEIGLVQPILVRPSGDEYELVCGHRRLRATKLAGGEEIQAIVRELDDVQVLEAALTENLQRSDIHPLEEAEGYRLLMERHGHKVADVAARVGRSVKYIYDRVKLLALTKEAQRLFLEDRFSAGHAVLLARLSAKDQEKALDPHGADHVGASRSGLFEGERASLFTDEEEDELGDKDKYHGLKPVSVRELQIWIDQNCKFDRKAPDPMLFPDTAAELERAEAELTKVVPIMHLHQVPPEAKDGERVLSERSWARADGQWKSKTCEHSVLGVIVVGPHRGDAFKVCTRKDKCKTHWGKEIAARERAAKQKDKGDTTSSKPAERPSWQIEEEKRKAKAAAWAQAAPAVLDAFAAAVAKSPTTATGLLAQTIMDKLYIRADQASAADKLIPLGKTADDFVRHVALTLLAGTICDTWNGHAETPKLGKAFGIDVAAIVKANTPKVPTPARAKGNLAKELQAQAKRVSAEAKKHKAAGTKKRKAL